ncbi:hypothetical protein [Mesorhizobium amorphae]|uniref:hypothetical protein n=1 Tax=Mesorhizobium amorphae TaxID=71433 RepID=UPI001185CCA2|nr:hypothetical protein [Mesorhizobium amorphae]
MRLQYTADIFDERLGIYTHRDYECELELSVAPDGLITIDAVYVDGCSLFSGDPLSRSLAGRIANDAETKLNTPGDKLRDRVLEREAA